MKQFWKDLFFRGCLAAAGGPVVLAIVYGILGATGTVTAFSPREVCLGILTVTLLAFLVAGMTAIYQLERLPLTGAIAIHGIVLYLIYIVIYLCNGWLQRQPLPILIFSGAFILGYAVIWLLSYAVTNRKAQQLTRKIQKQ